MESARNSGCWITLIGPVRSRTVRGALPVDGHKNSAPEKERHTPVEDCAGTAPDAAPDGGRPDGGIERLQILEGKADRARRSAVGRRIAGGQGKRRGRTIETGETTRYGTPGDGRVRKKETVRAAIQKARR